MLKSTSLSLALCASFLTTHIAFADEPETANTESRIEAKSTTEEIPVDPKTREQCEKIKGKNAAECAKGTKPRKMVTLKGAKAKTATGTPESTAAKGSIDSHNQ